MPGLSGVTGLSGLSGLFGGAFLPTDLDGLLLWLKADTGIFEDSTKTTPATDNGDVIGAWEDQSINGNDALQATTANKPTLRLSIINNKPVIRFDGINDILLVTSNITDSTITAFCVLRKNIVDAGIIGYARTQKMIFEARSVATDEWGIFLGLSVSSGQSVNTFTIVSTVVRNFDDVDLVTNGSLVNKITGIGFAANVTNIGSNIAASGNLDGDIAEFLIYDSSLSSSDRILVETYLNGRYAIF